MKDSADISVLAIDGGGTRCRFALMRGSDRFVIEAGSANASTDFENAVRTVLGGLQKVEQQSGMAPEALTALPAFVGLAGTIDQSIVTRLANALPFQNARYADDRLAALRGALGCGEGFVAHCGTGSFIAAQIGESQRFAGGWGAALGDESSAKWVGKCALSQLLRHVDGLAETSPLFDDLLAEFGDAAGVVAFAREANPAAFGALAPYVTAHADDGDPVAISILQSAAERIASNLKQMGWCPGLPICLTGGIGPHYASYLPEALQSDLVKPLGEPLDGAIALAQDRDKEIAHGYC